MCGIFGIIGTAATESAAVMMRASIEHRGPDQTGVYSAPGAALGCNRLAIIDPESGKQPIFNEDGSLLIVYNGEVYNHPELRARLEAAGHIFKTKTDTETVLHAYEEYGPRCAEMLNGMFAFAVWDTRDKTLFLARDRLGIKPLYISEPGGGLAFASEAKALLPVIPGGPKPDWTALFRFFSFGYVPAEDSPFEGIRKFPAGHYAVFKNGKLETTRYWRPEYGAGEKIDFDEAAGRLRELVEAAVRRELMSDVDLGVFLSGGLDSSAVALFAAKNSRARLRSFALKFEEPTHDESADAAEAARHLGIEHHEFAFTGGMMAETLRDVSLRLDEPFGDPTVLPLFALSKFTRGQVKAVLTGWGGDEIFAGYPTYRAHLLSRAYRKLPRLLNSRLIPAAVALLPVSDSYMSLGFRATRFVRGTGLSPELQHFLWMGYFDDAEKRRLFTDGVLRSVGGDTMSRVAAEIESMPERELISRIMHLDAVFFLHGNGLFQADRMTMAASLEARVPLLNNELVDFVNPLPAAVKMKGGRPKDLLRESLKDLLPARIISKPKKGFGPPTSAWTRGPFSGLLDDLFSPERVRGQGIFRYDEVERLIGEHRSRRADHGRNLWALISFQLWYDNFILGDPFL